jgi:hypothetical protein
MLVLCRREHDNIVDDDHQNGTKNHHHFVCTTNFVMANVVRIFFHVAVLFKSFVDEYVSNFLITRGVLLDVITILSSPPLIVFCLLTDICAEDVRGYLVKALNVTYEVNDITNKTPFYLSLADSMHRYKLEPVIFFLILLTTDIVAFLELPYLYPYGPYIFDSCVGGDDDNVMYVGETIFLSMMSFGAVIMCEFFFCKQLKYCTLFAFLTVNLGVRLWIVNAARTTYECLANVHYADDDIYGSNSTVPIFDDYLHSSSSVSMSFMDIYWKEMAIDVISGVVWVLFIFDNFSNISKRHVYVIADFVGFYCYVGAYCPLYPLYQYFVAPAADVIGVSAAVGGIAKQISRSISLPVINSLHVEQAASPEINPGRGNDSFTNV